MRLQHFVLMVALVASTASVNNINAADPAEILQRRIGTWITETTSRKAVWTPKQMTTKGEETIRWTLDKHVQVTEGWSKPDDNKSTGMMVYDKQAKQFRSWWFNNKGVFPLGETIGKWDAKNETLHFSTDLGNGNKQDLKLVFTNNDRFDWTMIIRNQDGRLMMDVFGHTTRKK